VLDTFEPCSRRWKGVQRRDSARAATRVRPADSGTVDTDNVAGPERFRMTVGSQCRRHNALSLRNHPSTRTWPVRLVFFYFLAGARTCERPRPLASNVPDAQVIYAIFCERRAASLGRLVMRQARRLAIFGKPRLGTRRSTRSEKSTGGPNPNTEGQPSRIGKSTSAGGNRSISNSVTLQKSTLDEYELG